MALISRFGELPPREKPVAARCGGRSVAGTAGAWRARPARGGHGRRVAGTAGAWRAPGATGSALPPTLVLALHPRPVPGRRTTIGAVRTRVTAGKHEAHGAFPVGRRGGETGSLRGSGTWIDATQCDIATVRTGAL